MHLQGHSLKLTLWERSTPIPISQHWWLPGAHTAATLGMETAKGLPRAPLGLAAATPLLRAFQQTLQDRQPLSPGQQPAHKRTHQAPTRVWHVGSGPTGGQQGKRAPVWQSHLHLTEELASPRGRLWH